MNKFHVGQLVFFEDIFSLQPTKFGTILNYSKDVGLITLFLPNGWIRDFLPKSLKLPSEINPGNTYEAS